MEFNSLSKTKAKELKALSHKKERDEKGLFIAEGEKCVLDLLPAFKLKYLICTARWIETHKEYGHLYGDNVLISDHRGIEIISSLQSLPEVIAIFHKPTYSETTILPNIDKAYFLLLDGIQDPGNLGTIIRTSDWFGVYHIYASKNTADAFSPKVVQATMGSLARVNIYYTDLSQLISEHREIPVIGTLLDGKPLSKVNLPDNGFLLMGNEGKGISSELKTLITHPVTIPPVNQVNHPDSLNVAIATGILLNTMIT